MASPAERYNIPPRNRALKSSLRAYLSVPLVFLGVYCIFPHPFYDCDCTFAVLACLLLLLHVEKKGFPPGLSFLAGIALVMPVFVKQNTGLAFLGSTVLAIVALMAIASATGDINAPVRLHPGWNRCGIRAGGSADSFHGRS